MIESEKQFLDTTVILPVSDVAETAQFYKEYLGFNIDILWENPKYASVSRENVVIEFGEGRKEYSGSGVCFIHIKDVDSVFEEFQNSKVKFIGDLSDRDYGSRDFRITDNNGNMLIFGSPLSDKEELIAKQNKA